MVEISYGEYYELADLAGKSVAEVRELYKPEFSIPDRAQASLNGKQLKKKLEPETKLGGEDKLSFEEKGSRGLALLGAFLLTLAITGGLFAFTYTTTSKTITVGVGVGDFASVSDNGADLDYTVLGRVRGTMGPGLLFDVLKTTGYTADLEVNVYLSNIDELQKDYSFWMMRLQLTDAAGNPVDIESSTQILSLDTPFVTFACDNWTEGTYRYIECEGGTYRAFPFSWLSGENPQIFAQVVQAGP